MEALLQRDVFIRKPMAPVLNRCIRISVGLDHELDIFAEELPRAIKAARECKDQTAGTQFVNLIETDLQ